MIQQLVLQKLSDKVKDLARLHKTTEDKIEISYRGGELVYYVHYPIQNGITSYPDKYPLKF